MGQIVLDTYPVQVTLEHDDTVVEIFTDDLGDHDVYLIERVYWEEKDGVSWVAVVYHPTTGQPVEQLISPYESGSKNLPTPARFNSYPLVMHVSLYRA